ncbi:MAG: RNA polymerase-binding protein DksA [Parasphingorhabdus sp.]|uniref:RNA polymerase-binding protein DksA n=1 Tax=Parasphingorhabdus sp. TaxID=2709688 RepID=UPI0032982110
MTALSAPHIGPPGESWRVYLASTANKKSASDGGSKNDIVLDDGYRPSADEEFMNERQQAYFKRALERWKQDIIEESKETLAHLQDGPIQEADLNDRASSETDWGLELRTRDRQRKLTSKIDAALRRLEEGEYGYCQVTGEPISLERLEARPIATMSVEAQEAHERNEKISRDQ